MQQRSHIRIFVLYDIAPLGLRRFFDVLSVVCVCIFAFAVVWGGFGEAAAKFWRFETFGTAFDPPIPATNKPLILMTLLVLALQAVSNLIRDWPSLAIVRKLFDIIATIVIVGLCAWALPILFSDDETLKLPLKWRVGIGALLLFTIAITLFGLFRDFNRTPEPLIESHDPADEFDLPDEVLTGAPPAVDTASGMVEPDNHPRDLEDPKGGRS